MATSRGLASHRHQLTDTLTLRWSTSEDRAGLALVGALAYGEREGREDDYAVRSSERLAMDEYPLGSSTSWAICVDTQGAPRTATVNTRDSPYVAKIRASAESAPDRVVAVIALAQHTWSFENNAATVTAGRITLSACRQAYRGHAGLMSGLFDMIHERCESRGDVMVGVNGIPGYYRKKGYEYGVSFGKGMMTQFGDLPLPSEPLPAMFDPSSSADSHTPNGDHLSPEYSCRQAEPGDAVRLLELHEMPRQTSSQWVAYMPNELEPYSQWLSGQRSGPFVDPDTSHHLDLPMREPVSVLEHHAPDGTRKIVAALVIHPSKHTRQVVASRVLFDSDADLAVVTRELLLRTVEAVLVFWRSVVAQQGKTEQIPGGGLNSEPSSMLWFLPKQHPISLHLAGQGLATPLVQNSLVLREDWSIRIPSMARFLQGIAPALQYRLTSARPLLGAAFSLTLRIGCYDLRYAGACIRIERCQIQSVEERQWQPQDLDRGQMVVGHKDGMNVVGTYANLVALLMGYKSRSELLASAPDFQFAAKAVVLCDVLFPKNHPSFPAYL